MASINKLFKALRNAPSKGVKRHITNEIVSMYCSTPALTNTLLEEILFLSESTAWEDRVAGSRILEEMFRLGTVSDSFTEGEFDLSIEIDELLKLPKFLATHYTPSKPLKGEKAFIDLDDHNVVLSLSNINIPGTKEKEGIIRRKKQQPATQKTEERKEIESKEEFYGCILKNLLSFVWEKRHGAAQILLGLFRGIYTRNKAVVPVPLKVLSPKDYLNPILTVLILDRFNDYEMDIAVSPVRETAAKALKELVSFLAPSTVKDLLVLLTQLGKYEDWQIKYSGLLGLQYIQSIISPNDHRSIVREIGSTCLSLLTDLDEDVKRIAATILTGIVNRYIAEYSAPEETDAQARMKAVRKKVDEVLQIEEIIEKAWEALEEEQDLASSKAKIMALLEVLSTDLNYPSGEITEERWSSVLSLIRNPIDTVRIGVLSLLSILPCVDLDSLIGSLMFSILAETEIEVKEKSSVLLRKVSQNIPEDRMQSIVHPFLSVVCSAYTTGASFSSLKIKIVVGECDICSTDDGCKSLGEEKVLCGRTNLFRVLVNSRGALLACTVSFFLLKKPAHPYFVFFKGVTAVYLLKQDETRHSAQAIIESMEKESEGKDKGDLSRGAYSLVEHARGAATKEDAEILVYLYSVSTPVSILRILSEAIRTDLSKFAGFLQLAVECVCAKEETAEKEEVVSTKKQKIAEDIEVQESEWEMLVLFKVLNSAFLETDVFDDLKKQMDKCAIFLQNTVTCFDYSNSLQFIFSYAVDNNMDKIVSYLIRHSRENNEEFILKVKERLEEAVENEQADHTAFFSFIVNTVESSRLFLLVCLVFPLVRAMNTPFKIHGLREMASKAFSIASPSMWMRIEEDCISKEITKEIDIARERVDSLMEPDDISKIDMQVSLREYQIKGVEWMGFLRKSGLSGMLCDDMGLGKTIQVLASIASQSDRCRTGCVLVLCPSSLTGHWHMEISTHFPTLSSTTVNDFKGTGICIASFDKFRINYEKFTKYSWFYLVLDEGHIIRNASTLLHQRVKMIRAENKILLSGTPIQNSVGELWALFDILMPGFLGEEKEFARTYIRPIEKAREGKGNIHETEVAKKKLEELHRKVLPFILRRMKETVLSDLPPKVISDVYVELEEKQRRIYESITEEEPTGEYGKTSSSSGNFSILMRLVKVCSHPVLLDPSDIPPSMSQKDMDTPSGKVLALLDLLKVMVQNNKILIFCQYKATIDRLIREVEVALPATKWMRLDGSIKGENRSALAKKFNSDPEISIMYLTTHAGGLGLNLTGADAVIFFEHDWNPMMDLQAMDRAHRIGQKKSVNVFRLISKNTIEEKIMSLQKFKNYIANTVVNQQNVEIECMDTSNALERLTRDKAPDHKISKEEEYHDFI